MSRFQFPPMPTSPAGPVYRPGPVAGGLGQPPRDMDQASAMAARMAPYSPLARAAQDQSRDAAVAGNVNAIATRRSGPSAPAIGLGPRPGGPIGVASPLANAPPYRPGGGPSRVEANPNLRKYNGPVKPAGAGANWRVTEPRGITGSPTANWRLHPGGGAAAPPPPPASPKPQPKPPAPVAPADPRLAGFPRSLGLTAPPAPAVPPPPAAAPPAYAFPRTRALLGLRPGGPGLTVPTSRPAPAPPAPAPVAPAPSPLIPDPSKTPSPALAVPPPPAPAPVVPPPPQVPTPAGMPAYNRNIGVGRKAARGVSVGRPATMGQSSDPNVTLRRQVTEGIDRKIAEAQAKGDDAAVANLAAQRSALDTGGFVGMAKHLHEMAMNEANRNAVGARTASLDAKSGAAATSSPEAAWMEMYKKTADERAADVAARHVRMENSRTSAAATGGATKVDPNDAASILEARYPAAAPLFATDKAGSPVNRLHELHAQLRALGQPGFDDPKSEFSQAAAARVRQIYGTNLADELFVTANPADYRPRQLPRGFDWLTNYPAHLGAMASNAFNGRSPFDAHGDHKRTKAAADWYNNINNAK